MQNSHVLPRQQRAAGQTWLMQEHIGQECALLQVADFSRS